MVRAARRRGPPDRGLVHGRDGRPAAERAVAARRDRAGRRRDGRRADPLHDQLRAPGALHRRAARGRRVAGRLRGLRANASLRSHAELDEADELDEGDPADLAERHVALRELLPDLAVLGGCCGTDIRHVTRMADVWLSPRAERTGGRRYGRAPAPVGLSALRRPSLTHDAGMRSCRRATRPRPGARRPHHEERIAMTIARIRRRRFIRAIQLAARRPRDVRALSLERSLAGRSGSAFQPRCAETVACVLAPARRCETGGRMTARAPRRRSACSRPRHRRPRCARAPARRASSWRPTWRGSSASTRSSTRSSRARPSERSRPRTRPTGAARGASSCRRCTGCRWRTRICRTRPACARPTARRRSRARARRRTPCSSRACARRGRSRSARRTRRSGAPARTRSTRSSA